MLSVEIEDRVVARQASRNGNAAALRQRAGLTQDEIAQAAGVSAATISRWEAGIRRPTGAASARYGRILRELATRLESAP